MWVLVAAIFVAVLVALYLLMSFQSQQAQSLIQGGTDEVSVTAMQAVQLMKNCMQQSPGSYTQAQLGGAGYAAQTPTGPSWVCQVTAGGSLPNGNAAVLYLDGPPKLWGTAAAQGQTGASSAAVVQMNFATLVAGVAAQAISGQKDIVAGVVNAGDPEPYLHVIKPAPQDVSLAGDMPANLSYSTPALAAGVFKSAF